MRVKVDWRSASKDNYISFCKENPHISLPFDMWQKIVYDINYSFRDHILETGDKIKLPFGLGEISINKKKRKKTKIIEGKEFINLPIDWKRTKEKGKKIYNFNHHTEGYFFGWIWFRNTARFKHRELWFFKPSRITSRAIAVYINKEDKYQYIYNTWKP